MTTAATTPGESRSRTASAIVLGADAVLAAHPATAVQLAHACLRAGYATVIPASWGDELLATETIRQLRASAERPFVYCACPHVSDRLLDVGDDLAPFLIPLVAPPIAVALHLREIARGEPLEITFVGACPAGDDASIDAHFTPADFLAMLAHRGIALLEQPDVFDSVLPPDRRRHRSLPGGVPTADTLWSEGDRRALIEIADSEPLTELAQHLATGEPALLDLGPALACACSGAVPGVPPRSARSAVCALEPPRSRTEIIEPSPLLQLTRPLHGTRDTHARSRPTVSATAGSTPPAHLSDTSVPSPESAPGTEVPARKRATTTAIRAPAGSMPRTNSGEGRALPRAYVARRPGRRRTSTESEHGESRSGEAARVASTAGTAPSPDPVAGGPASSPPEPRQVAAGASATDSIVPYAQAETPAEPVVQVRNGRSPGRVFASVPIAPAQPAARESSARAASTDVKAPAAAEPRAPAGSVDAPSTAQRVDLEMVWERITTSPVVLREQTSRFARYAAERPRYLGILIAVVALLSIALGVAAGRALRGATPMTAEPTEHGAGGDSLFGTSSSVREAGQTEPPARDPTSATSEAAGTRDAGGARNRAGGSPPTRQPPPLRQSAGGNVAPPASARTPAPSRAAARGDADVPGDRDRIAAARRDSIAADSARRAAAVADSLRRDSVATDSARRAGVVPDSVAREARDTGQLIRPGVVPTAADSLLQREREELRRDLAERQRRIDSLQRWLDSARRTPPPPR